jgi:hypothetical protein
VPSIARESVEIRQGRRYIAFRDGGDRPFLERLSSVDTDERVATRDVEHLLGYAAHPLLH